MIVTFNAGPLVRQAGAEDRILGRRPAPFTLKGAAQ